MVCCTDAEIALKKRFETAYARSTHPVMQEIERHVCGCDYGGNSWTTKEQADEIPGLLGLTTGTELIDLGAGTGWPALYLATISGCSVALVDLPEVGLKLANERASRDGLDDRISVHVSDASALPFNDTSFDAVSHSDLLCCLLLKREAILECRRIIRPSGSMVFSVISIAPDVSEDQLSRALANAPEFVEVECDYETLLTETGWNVTGKTDLTEDYRRSCARQVETDLIHNVELAELLGPNVAEERLAGWANKLRAIEDGLYLREQYSCRPC